MKGRCGIVFGEALFIIRVSSLKDYDSQRETCCASRRSPYPTQQGISTIDCIYDE
jgi:hypothetical protein